ncbi:hypothetical protein NL676_037031 [Syzygium grande]|nr:hypothetical protein NL676_037031 [Syzygium grande]
MGTTKHLQDVLKTRTQNIKAHENRKQMFSANASRENHFKQHTKAVTEPPPWSSASNESGSPPQAAMASNGSQVGNQLRRRLAVDNSPSDSMEMSMLQQVVPQQENYSQSRATALHNVESTIAELGGIFTHLASMVAQQGEVAIRIDDNMEESLVNVEGARSALLRHLNQISSNSFLFISMASVLFILRNLRFYRSRGILHIGPKDNVRNQREYLILHLANHSCAVLKHCETTSFRLTLEPSAVSVRSCSGTTRIGAVSWG